MMIEIDERHLGTIREAIFLGQEKMQNDWERALSLNVPEEVREILWLRWARARNDIEEARLW